MARILVNYVYNKFADRYEIQNNSYVFADMKVAVLETEDEIKVPLVVPIKDIMTVVDKERFEKIHKKFYLVADENGIISENPNGTEMWLPKDTDLTKLRYINGHVVMIPDEEPKEEPKKEVKKENKTNKK